jgi:hypothetical protein
MIGEDVRFPKITLVMAVVLAAFDEPSRMVWPGGYYG